MAELSWDSVMDALNTNNVPEICLLLMGVVALVIVGYYRSDKDSGLYKAMVAVGVITGIFLVVVAVMAETSWSKGTLLVVTVASFALITRPIKDVNIAAIIGLVVAIWVYLILPDAVSDLNSPFEFLEVLGEGIPRIIVAVVAGGIVFTILQFIQALVMLFGKIFNAWPFLLVIGIWCIVESIFLMMGYNSTSDYISTALNGSE